MSYIVLRGHWCNSIVLNVHSSGHEKSDDAKQFYEELEQGFLTCICLTAGVILLTPPGHRQIRDVITTGIDMCGRRMRKGGGDGPYIRRAAD